MNILYVHGFGSRFDPHSDKVVALSKLGTVWGVDVDYTQGFRHAIKTVSKAVIEREIDLVVGTSMGGYMAIEAAFVFGIEFVALNPACWPSTGLSKWQGSFVDFVGNQCFMSADAVASYPDVFVRSGVKGTVFVEAGDSVIDVAATIQLLSQQYPVQVFPGGSHRFESIDRVVNYMIDV